MFNNVTMKHQSFWKKKKRNREFLKSAMGLIS